MCTHAQAYCSSQSTHYWSTHGARQGAEGVGQGSGLGVQSEAASASQGRSEDGRSIDRTGGREQGQRGGESKMGQQADQAGESMLHSVEEAIGREEEQGPLVYCSEVRPCKWLCALQLHRLHKGFCALQVALATGLCMHQWFTKRKKLRSLQAAINV